MSNKMSIEWHRRYLENTERYLEMRRRSIESMQKEFEREKIKAEFLKKQIETAVLQKKEGFDSELFLKKHKPEVA